MSPYLGHTALRQSLAWSDFRGNHNTRPESTVHGHIAASFLAPRLEVDLKRLPDERKIEVSRPDLMRGLPRVHSVIIDLESIPYRLRTNMAGSSYQAFEAAGIRPPETVSLLGPAPQNQNLPCPPYCRACSAKLLYRSCNPPIQ